MSEEHRAQWIKERKLGVGGSDVHAVFNDKPDGCARQLWYDKTDTPQDFPWVRPGYLELGQVLEDFVAEWYAKETGAVLARSPALVHPAYPFMRVNVDRLIDLPNRPMGVLEIKTHHGWLFTKIVREGLKAAHIRQLIHGMAITGATWGAFAVLNRENGDRIHFELERDERLVTQQQERIAAFWAQVEARTPPDPLPEVDARCAKCPWRHTCRGMTVMYDASGNPIRDPQGQEYEVWDTPALQAATSDYLIAKAEVDGAEATLAAARQRLIEALEGHEAVKLRGAKIVYRESAPVTRWDTAALKRLPMLLIAITEDAPARRVADMAARIGGEVVDLTKYQKTSPGSRALRVYITAD